MTEQPMTPADVEQWAATLPALPRPSGPLWSLLDWSLWGAGLGDVLREPVADAMLTALPERVRDLVEQVMADFIERRKIERTGVTVWQEQRDELAALRAEVERLRAAQGGDDRG